MEKIIKIPGNAGDNNFHLYIFWANGRFGNFRLVFNPGILRSWSIITKERDKWLDG